jgi:hypothetical protein
MIDPQIPDHWLEQLIYGPPHSTTGRGPRQTPPAGARRCTRVPRREAAVAPPERPKRTGRQHPPPSTVSAYNKAARHCPCAAAWNGIDCPSERALSACGVPPRATACFVLARRSRRLRLGPGLLARRLALPNPASSAVFEVTSC